MKYDRYLKLFSTLDRCFNATLTGWLTFKICHYILPDSPTATPKPFLTTTTSLPTDGLDGRSSPDATKMQQETTATPPKTVSHLIQSSLTPKVTRDVSNAQSTSGTTTSPQKTTTSTPLPSTATTLAPTTTEVLNPRRKFYLCIFQLYGIFLLYKCYLFFCL